MTKFKIVYAILSGVTITYFPRLRICNVISLSLTHLYIHDTCSDDPHSLVPAVQIFTVSTRRAIFTNSNYPLFPPYSNGKEKVLTRYAFFFKEQLLCGIDSSVDAFLKTITSTFSSQCIYLSALFYILSVSRALYYMKFMKFRL